MAVRKDCKISDKEFDQYYATLDAAAKLDWLSKNLGSATVRRGFQSYGFNSPDDLDAMIEQELYERMTERQ